jgi:hypothetical protein
MLAGFGEAIALRELALHDSVVVYDGGVRGWSARSPSGSRRPIRRASP